MPATVESILGHLAVVDAERAARARSPSLANRVAAIKAYQQQRFAHTYADLLTTPRYANAARFFLDELYGPGDFSQRDAQFSRVVPSLVRLFPRDVVATVDTLAQVHALSETLDSEMGRQLPDARVDAPGYMRAWQATGRDEEREAQIELTLSVGAALDQLTRKPMLRQSLRLMRAPARATGLGALQQFLESGFDTFAAMKGAKEFLSTVQTRERALKSLLFEGGALGQLP